MGSTIHYEADLPVGDGVGNRDCTVQVVVSSFHGSPELYLRVGDGKTGTVLLDREQAREFLGGLESAMRYLGYDR